MMNLESYKYINSISKRQFKLFILQECDWKKIYQLEYLMMKTCQDWKKIYIPTCSHVCWWPGLDRGCNTIPAFLPCQWWYFFKLLIQETGYSVVESLRQWWGPWPRKNRLKFLLVLKGCIDMYLIYIYILIENEKIN